MPHAFAPLKTPPLQHALLRSLWRPAPRIAPLVLLLALAGCASLPHRDAALPGVSVPTTWSAPAPAVSGVGNPSLATWWQKFNDPVLGQLVMQALQANTSVRTAQAALQQSRAVRDVRGADALPSVGGSASIQRSRSGNNGTSNSFRVGLDASWEPDLFGGIRANVDAAEADTRVAEATLADAQVSIAAEVALAYIQLRGQQSQLAIARSNLASQQETLQITDWRAQAGLITSLEVEQARASSEQTAAQIPALEAAIAATQHGIAVLVGQPPAALKASLAAAVPVPVATDDLALDIPTETLRQRPDVRAAEQRISAALSRVSVADAARYPSFSLGGSIGLGALTLGALTSGASVATALLGSVSVPLFDGGAARAQVKAQEAALEQARVAYEATVLTALKDVEDALVALQGNRDRLVRLQSAAVAAGNAALLAQQRFSSGLIDFQTVLQTQRTLLTAQDSVATTNAEISAGHVRLYKALGGGWS